MLLQVLYRVRSERQLMCNPVSLVHRPVPGRRGLGAQRIHQLLWAQEKHGPAVHAVCTAQPVDGAQQTVGWSDM